MSTKEIALSGLISAFSILTLWLASALPGSRLAIAMCSAFALEFLYAYTRRRCGILAYLSVLCFSLFLLPGKMVGVLYALYFGGYVTLRRVLPSRPWVWLLKGLYLNGVTLLLYGIADVFFPDVFGRIRGIALWQIFLFFCVLQVIWVIVDIFLSYVTRVLMGFLSERGIKK